VRCQYRGGNGKRASVRYPSSPRGQVAPPPFIGKERQFTIVPHSSSYAWRYGVQCHRGNAVLANLASGGASLQVLYPSRDGFEGCGVGASHLVVHASARGLG
jgi:hypothetical protein